MERAEALGVQDATLAELEALHTKSRARAEELARAVGLMRQVLSVTDRDPEADLDVRAEALAASFLRNVQAFPHAKAHLRSARLAEDGVLEDIGVAQDLATEAAAAASEADLAKPRRRLLLHRYRPPGTCARPPTSLITSRVLRILQRRLAARQGHVAASVPHREECICIKCRATCRSSEVEGRTGRA